MACWKMRTKYNSEKKIHELKWKIHSLIHQPTMNTQKFQALKAEMYSAYKEEEAFSNNRAESHGLRKGTRIPSTFMK